MTEVPVLATLRLPERNSATGPLTVTVRGGLHTLRGNDAPYFSLTSECHYDNYPGKRYRDDDGHFLMQGADHSFILKHFPQFADLAKLHLSDINGVPMHAEANAWYWLAGAAGGAGERFHGGGAHKSAAGCSAILGKHLRVDEGVVADLVTVAMARPARAKAKLVKLIERLTPQWKAEADACIAKHGLQLFGDIEPRQPPRAVGLER